MFGLTIRKARVTDAGFIARMANMAGEGIPLLLWSRRAGDAIDPWEIGREDAMSHDEWLSYTRCSIAELNGKPCGMVMSGAIPEVPEPPSPGLPAMFAPLVALEAEAPGTEYVSMIATEPMMRGRGVGTALLAHAERSRGPRGMSLVVSDGNEAARTLYRHLGYHERARRPIIHDGWDNPSRDWVLMVKSPGDVSS